MSTNKYILIAIGGIFLLIMTLFAALLGFQLLFRPLDLGPDPVVIVQTTEAPDATQVPATPVPTATAVPTETGPEPTATAAPTAQPTPAPTTVPVPCHRAGFVLDVTAPDGSDYLPGETFVKTWRLKNLGSCTWTTEYDLVFVGGSRMSAPQAVALKARVEPGKTIDVSVSLVAPADTGSYRGYWQLRSASGQLFGLGNEGTGTFWADIDVALPCNWAHFVKDVTIADNTRIPAGGAFKKIWRIKNAGSCTWTTQYDLVFDSGDKLGAGSLAIPLPEKVRPGETVDLAVQFIAPLQLGDYRGYWMLRDGNGKRFGLGDDQDSPFWVDIKVIPPAGPYRYDFAANFCLAAWRSAEKALNCMGSQADGAGFVLWVANPRLENRQENEPALWLHPNESSDGWISGTYPEIKIKEGDRFRTWVGCMAGYDKCNLTFRLDYRIDGGAVQTLGIWHEVYDGQVSVVDINLTGSDDQNALLLDLSSLAGMNVQFIFRVSVESNARHAQAFWFAPRIEND